MIRLVFVAFILLLLCSTGMATQVSDIWPGLDSLRVDSIEGIGEVTIFYNPRLARVINKKVENEAQFLIITALSTRLSHSSQDMFVVEYNQGPSADPEFILYKEIRGKRRRVLRQSGLTLIIPGDGFLYIAGHTDNYFDQRKKLVYRKGTFSEVSQPYYSVGLRTKLLAPAIMHSDRKKGAPEVARLPEGTHIEVVLNHGDYYLIKTQFGLLGWLKAELREGGTGTQIEGLYYAGD